MRYIDFIEFPPIKNQRIFIGNVLDKRDVLDADLKDTYLEARLKYRPMRYYSVYSTQGFYSGYSSTPRCIVKALDFEAAIAIAKAKGLVELDASIDHDFGDGSPELHNPTKLPVIELVWK